jgi:hypothetical protein
MRPVLFAGLVVLVVPAIGLAQSGSYLAVVADPEVKLRAGPSDKYPETATLTKGAAVLVIQEDASGWLAVCDPPGKGYSMSWVQASFVDFDNTKPIPQPVTVEADTTLAAGQIGLSQPLHIRLTKVPAGTGLLVIGTKVQFEGKWWHPVLPTADDFRYLPKQSVKYDKPANTSFVVRDSLPSAVGSLPALSPPVPSAPAASLPGPGSTVSLPKVGTEPAPPATTAAKPVVQNPLWTQAETAEREGRLDDAEKLYFQLARVMNEPGGDHDIANLCYTRIHSLREKKRALSGVSTSNPKPPPTDAVKPAVAVQPVASGSGSPPPPNAVVPDDKPRWTGPGRLSRSSLALDGRRTYSLDGPGGVAIVYVVPGQGIDLEKYVGKKVDLYGLIAPYRGISKPYVVATGVEAGQ